MRRLLAFCCTFGVLTATGCASSVGHAQSNALLDLSGKWGWVGSSDCELAPQVISLSADRKVMRLSYAPEDDTGIRQPREEAVYSVLGETSRGLNLAMQREDRLDSLGDPVRWELVVLSSAEYCWHRSDWEQTGCTDPVRRCEI